MLKSSFLSFFIRGLTLGSKFVLLLYLVKYLTPYHLGLYSIISSSVYIGVCLIGFDFYIFNTREVLNAEFNKKANLIFNQAILHLITYCIAIPFAGLLLLIDVIPSTLFLWFFVLLIFEHISQEVNRLLINLGHPIMANLVLFYRAGLWVYIVTILMALGIVEETIYTILAGWLLGIILSLIVVLWLLRKAPRFDWKQRIQWSWIWSGLNSSLPFFLSTLSLKSIEYADRYFINAIWGTEQLGIYAFYIGIANAIQVLVYSGIGTIMHPKIIISYQSGRVDEYNKLIREFGLSSILGTIIIGFLLAGFILFISPYIGRPEYLYYFPIYWIMLFGTIVNIAGQVPHYALYVRRQDRQILYSTIIGSAVVVVCDIVMVPTLGINGAALGLLFGILSMVFSKIYYLRAFHSCSKKTEIGGRG